MDVRQHLAMRLGELVLANIEANASFEAMQQHAQALEARLKEIEGQPVKAEAAE